MEVTGSNCAQEAFLEFSVAVSHSEFVMCATLPSGGRVTGRSGWGPLELNSSFLDPSRRIPPGGSHLQKWAPCAVEAGRA